MLDYF